MCLEVLHARCLVAFEQCSEIHRKLFGGKQKGNVCKKTGLADQNKQNKTKQIGISVKCYTMNNFRVPICKLNALRF